MCIAVIGGAWFARECRTATAEADRQTGAFLQAMARSDYETAFSLSCADGDSATYEEFKAQFAQAGPYFKGYVQHSTSSSGLTVSTSGPRRLDYDADVTFSDGSVGQFVGTFLKNQGRWCLQEFNLTGRPIAPPQTVLPAGGTPTATAGDTPSSRLTYAMLPLLQEYFRAVGHASTTVQGKRVTYAQAVENPQLQPALEDAFRRAQDILRASITSSPDERDCVDALLEWARFATDYWNSLSRALINKVPSNWNYAVSFEGELKYREGQLPSKCPALVGSLGTTFSQPQ